MLDTLSLSANDIEAPFRPILAEDFLTALEISSLKTVKFENVCFNHALSLIDFLRRHSSCVRDLSLSLHDTVVELGSWEEIFDEMRQLPPVVLRWVYHLTY